MRKIGYIRKKNEMQNIKTYFSYIVCALLSFLAALFFSDDAASIISITCSIVYILIAMKKPIEQRLNFVAMAISNSKALCVGPISVSMWICTLSVCVELLKKGNKSSIIGLIGLYLCYSLQFLVRCGINDGIIVPMKMSMALLFFSYLSSNKTLINDSFICGLKASLCLLVGSVFALSASFFGLQDLARMAVAGNDSNMLAVEIASVAAYLCVFYYSTNLLKQYVFLLLLGAICLISLVCGSRMGLLLIAISLFISLLTNINQIKKSTILIIGSFLLLFAILTSEVGKAAIEILRYRSEALESRGDVSNGRFEIWQQYFNVFNENSIRWFLGLGDFKEYGIEMQGHNFLIEDIASYGIIGTILLYFIMFKILRKQYKNQNRVFHNKNKLFKYIPILIPIIGGLTLHGLTSVINLTMLYIGTLALSSPFINRNYEDYTNKSEL